MGPKIILRDCNDFARMIKTDFWSLLYCFWEVEVELRIFLSEEKRGKKLDLEKFCPKSAREKGNWTKNNLFQVKGRS